MEDVARIVAELVGSGVPPVLALSAALLLVALVLVGRRNVRASLRASLDTRDDEDDCTHCEGDDAR